MPAPTREELAQAPHYRSVIGPAAEGEPSQLSDPFRALRRDGSVWTSEGERLSPEDFAMHSVRCSADGMPIVPLLAPLYIQLRGLATYQDAFPGAPLGPHREDVRSLREAMPEMAEGIEDDAVRAEAQMTDAMLAGVRDAAMPQGTQAAAAVEPRGPDPVIRTLARDTYIPEGAWTHATDMDAYQVETMRAMARQMLTPVMGNAAALEDLRFLAIPHDEPERGNALRRWIGGSEGSRTLTPFTHAAMPGYRTNEPVLAERDGVALLTYADRYATYAWAWQANPGATLDMPDPEPPEDDLPAYR